MRNVLTNFRFPLVAVLFAMITLPFVFPAVCDAVEIIGHRGASYLAPENTAAAVRLAFELGADAAEIDVYLSSDGRIVVLHDETTERTTNRDWVVARHTLAELRTLDAGSWKHAKYAGERLPTLAEMLAAVPEGKRIFIEIKCGAEILPELRRMLLATDKRPEETVLIDFNFDTIVAAKRLMPDRPAYWLHGTSPKRDKQTGRLGDPPGKLAERCLQAGLDGLNIAHDSRIDRALLDFVHDSGMKLYVWTVNSPDDARRLIDLRIDGITTDRPGWLREQLTK